MLWLFYAMPMKQSLILLIALFLFPLLAPAQPPAKGKLFIIGGGKRPAPMIDRLIQEAGLQQGGWALILPMASAEPDSALWYAKKQFSERGVQHIGGFVPDSTRPLSPARLDSIRQAKLIYLPGGDQSRLMRQLQQLGADAALREAYQRGAVIAGTSAGAAVMSRHMITGTEKRHPDYQPTFEHLEADNLELTSGLGLLPPHVLIDQHFVKRSRYNRLLTAVMEQPDWLGIGIDEATALLVHGNRAEVVGDAQVVLFRNPTRSRKKEQHMLGARKLQLDIYLPGEQFSLSSKP
jgi:cyanophycinase